MKRHAQDRRYHFFVERPVIQGRDEYFLEASFNQPAEAIRFAKDYCKRGKRNGAVFRDADDEALQLFFYEEK